MRVFIGMFIGAVAVWLALGHPEAWEDWKDRVISEAKKVSGTVREEIPLPVVPDSGMTEKPEGLGQTTELLVPQIAGPHPETPSRPLLDSGSEMGKSIVPGNIDDDIRSAWEIYAKRGKP